MLESDCLQAGEWCGLELDIPAGAHDGRVDDTRYFASKASPPPSSSSLCLAPVHYTALQGMYIKCRPRD